MTGVGGRKKLKNKTQGGGEMWADLHIMEEKGESFLGGRMNHVSNDSQR